MRRFSRRDAAVHNLSVGTDHTYYVTAAEGAVIRLATPIEDMRRSSVYAKEINYLLDHGYTFNSSGIALMPS